MEPLVLIGGIFLLAILVAAVGRVTTARKDGWSKGYDEGYADGYRHGSQSYADACAKFPLIEGEPMPSGTPFRASATKTRKPRADKGLRKCVCGRRFKANGIKRHQFSCEPFNKPFNF